MKHSATIAAIICAASVALTAQQPQTTTPATTPQTAPAGSTQTTQAARPPQADAQKSVTVAGCLKPIEAPGGVAATTASNPQYMLTNARVVPAASTGAATATPPASTAPSAAGTASFAVVAENVEELRAQSNHQVEITGRLEPIPAGSASGAVGTAGTTGAAAPPTMRLRVDAVKQIAASCATQP